MFDDMQVLKMLDEDIKVMPRIEWIPIACIVPMLQKSPAAAVQRRHISSTGLCVLSKILVQICSSITCCRMQIKCHSLYTHTHKVTQRSFYPPITNG